MVFRLPVARDMDCGARPREDRLNHPLSHWKHGRSIRTGTGMPYARMPEFSLKSCHTPGCSSCHLLEIAIRSRSAWASTGVALHGRLDTHFQFAAPGLQYRALNVLPPRPGMTRYVQPRESTYVVVCIDVPHFHMVVEGDGVEPLAISGAGLQPAAGPACLIDALLLFIASASPVSRPGRGRECGRPFRRRRRRRSVGAPSTRPVHQPDARSAPAHRRARP